MIDDLPLGLRHALENENCVLFVGAGAGAHFRRADGTTAPDGKMLAQAMAEHFSIATDEYDLSSISQLVEKRRGRKELDTFVRTQLDGLVPDETFQWFFTRRWKAIYTTNYDGCIERAYSLNPSPLQTPVSLSFSRDIVSIEPRFQVPVVHLHGSLFGDEEPKIVITTTDYVRFREHRRMLFEKLKEDFATATFMYIGYSHRDPNWQLVFNELTSEFLPNRIPQSYRVTRSTPQLQIEVLESQGVETITCDLIDFVRVASANLSPATIDDAYLSRMRREVPPDLIDAFNSSPPATTRLIKSWLYVNQAPFDAHPNLPAFLKGDRPNWALIAAGGFFARDIDDHLLNDLLDYATSTKSRPTVAVLLGPAGFGITTTLLAAAVKIVQERAGIVFILRPGMELIEGDIEFAISINPRERVFFFIDDASSHRRDVESTLTRLKSIHRSAMFVLGSRLNEWRQADADVMGTEFLLEALSDSEVDRLIEFLDKHNSLGELKDLSPEMRVAAVKEKHGKQLLVTMREVTERSGFDAIIEDEFRKIKNDVAQKAYMLTCAFYQHNTHIRDGLMANCLDTPLTDLHPTLNRHADGVIIFDLINESYGVYGARARHRTIADIVWLRCGQVFNRDSLLQEALSNMNLNFGPDKVAFEQFYREDVMVDSISTFDGKVRYFESACRKDPDSPYVRQHYARMLEREKKYDLALGQIDAAISLSPKVRVLYHTKGKILSSLTLSLPDDSLALARKRLAQAEESFRQGLRMKQSDEYCFQGLAELYLGWAKRFQPNDPESVDYIAKAEETVTEGLRRARVKEGLWLISAQIEDWLGNQPERLKALERAANESPLSVVPRFLLGRAYRNAGKLDLAKSTLEGLVTDHPQESRACLELARTMLELNSPYKPIIAILKLGTLHGYFDPKYISTLGGLLFLDGEFTEADDVFTQRMRLNRSHFELNRPHFRPRDRADLSRPLRFSGSVASVRNGYAFIDVKGYPQIYSPSTQWGGLRLSRGMAVEFDLVFSPTGPQTGRLQSPR